MVFSRFSFIFIILILLNGCLLKDKHNLKVDLKITPENKAIITGDILENPKSNKPIYLILFKLTGKDPHDFKHYSIVDFTSIRNPKPYQFIVNKGAYFLYACQNLQELQDKRYAYEFESKAIIIKQNKQTFVQDVKLKTTPSIVEDENILIGTKQSPPFFNDIKHIKFAKLKDQIFNRDNANVGLWETRKFYKNVGGGLYLLDKFDSNKTPILFVHGMRGTPQDFTTIIKHLDKSKYLPMVFYYASGSNLNYTVDSLRYLMALFQETYKVNKAIIIAHSMGGLVARAYINTNHKIKIEKFITLSTPWNGQKSAKLGEGIANRIAESFGNMVPGSAFQTNNLDTPLPPDLKHYLLFSYKGKDSFLLDESNDGVISLSSQLFPKAQRQAYFTYGINETHVGILHSKKTTIQINKILLIP